MTNEQFISSLSTGMISAFAYGMGRHLSGDGVVWKQVIFVGTTGTLVSMVLKAAAKPIVARMT